MNTSTEACSTSVPWWTPYVVSVSIFVLGFIIIGLSSLISIIKRQTRSTSKVAMLRRKSRMLMNPFAGDGDSDIDDDPEDESRMSTCSFLRFSLWCERMTSQRSSVGRIMVLWFFSFK